MKRSIFILLGFLTFMSFSQISAQQVEDSSQPGGESADAFAIIPNLEPEEVRGIDPYTTKVIFKTNIKNCRIYLNQNFQGYSKLSLSNLVEGFYLLRAEKEGYDYQEKFVYVERGKEKTFYVELQPNEETQKKLEARANAPAKEQNVEAEPEATAQEDSGLGEIK